MSDFNNLDLNCFDENYLHTVSMTELYDTVYENRPPIVDGLLYSGLYLFVGSPKIGKSFLMAQLANMVGVSRQTINAIEKGDYNPTIKLCISICRTLGKTLDELFWE